MKDSLLPQHGADNAVQNIMGARPTSTIVPRSHPDFSKKLKHMRQSDPVNPKDLTKRLELLLREQKASPDGILPRRVRRPRTSTTNSVITSGPPTPPQNLLRTPRLPDSLGHNLDFPKFVDDATASQLGPASNRPKSVVKNFAYPIPVAVLSPPSARQSAEISNTSPLYLTTLSGNLPPPPRTSRIDPLKEDIFLAHDEPVSVDGGNANARKRPESACVPRTAGKQWLETAIPKTGTRQSIQVMSPCADEQPFESLPFLTLDPLSPIRRTFSNDVPQNTVANSPGLSILSPGARTSIATESTYGNYTTAPTSPAVQPVNSINTVAPPPAEVTPRLQKRKSWHPKNLISSIKPTRSESNDRRHTGFQTTAVMVEAARQGQAREVKIKPRPRSTAFEDLSVGTFTVPELPGTGAVPPMPTLHQSIPEDSNIVKQGKGTPVRESIWNRRLRRKTIGDEEAERLKDATNSMSTVDKLRWKQLSMREKALADSKKAKADQTIRPKSQTQQDEWPNLEQQTTVPPVYEPMKRNTHLLKIIPPTTSTQTFRGRDLSPTRYIPRKPIDPQEIPHSPVEVRPILRPKGENYPERTSSRCNRSPITPISPLALSLDISSLPQGVHLLDEMPMSADEPARTASFPKDVDCDARATNATARPAEAKEETADKPKQQRRLIQPKLVLGPFPPSRPVSPSSNPPPQKPLPQPPRLALVQPKPYKLHSPTGNAPAEQLMPWDQPVPLAIPDSMHYTRSASPPREQRQAKHAREVSITKVVSAPRVVTSPAVTPALEISAPREIAQWEILPPREAPSPTVPQFFDFRPRSPADELGPQLDRKRSQPMLNQHGEPPLRPRASSTDVKSSSDALQVPMSRANPNALRPKTSCGFQTTPVSTVEVRDDEIAEMTPASVKLLREQQSLLRRRALAEAGHSDPDAAMRRSPTPLAETRDGARGTIQTSTTTTAHKAIGRSTVPLAGPGSARNPPPTHIGSGAAERQIVRSLLGSHRKPNQSTSHSPPSGKESSSSSSVLPSTAPTTAMHSAAASVTMPVVPHVSGSQMMEERKVERERGVDASRARYGLPPARSVAIPTFSDEKFNATGGERMEVEKSRRRGKDKWWKIWRVV